MTIDRRLEYYKRVLATVFADKSAFKERLERGKCIQQALKQRWNLTDKGKPQA